MWPIDWLLMYCIFDARCLLGPPNRATPTATRLLAAASAQILVAPYLSKPIPLDKPETTETALRETTETAT